jgi:phosphohistidine phosphatase SixA
MDGQQAAPSYEMKPSCEDSAKLLTEDIVDKPRPYRLFVTGSLGALAGATLLGAYFVFGLSPTSAAKQENLVVLMRHGDAPGRHEPKNFDLNDCSTQRNLSDKGRTESKVAGRLIRASALQIRAVISSRWCRTRETAELLKLSPVKPEAAFDNLEFNKARSAELLQAERNIIRAWRGPGILLVVTHSSNIKALTGLEVDSGSMVIANPSPNGEITYRLSSILLKDLFL